MRIVCISDTHDLHPVLRVPDGDLLIHAGDATAHGTEEQIKDFCDWFRSQPHRHKIFVAGNHDWLFETDPDKARHMIGGFTYLEDSAVEVEGLLFYGSPWTIRYYEWAFMLERGAELAVKWRHIPDNTDVLITHSPPKGILDRNTRGESAGCGDLLKRVRKITPKLHVFGHMHPSNGIQTIGETVFVNAAIAGDGREYLQAGEPIVVDI
jgi:Icc-related predicted phosphoesterase